MIIGKNKTKRKKRIGLRTLYINHKNVAVIHGHVSVRKNNLKTKNSFQHSTSMAMLNTLQQQQ